MASDVSIAIRKADAQKRIAKAAATLAKAKGVDVPELAPRSKDLAVQGALQVEAVADFLEALATEPEPEAKPKAETKPAAEDKAKDGK